MFDEIGGIGPIKKQAIMIRFRGLQEIRMASVETLCTVPGINNQLAQKIVDYFKQ